MKKVIWMITVCVMLCFHACISVLAESLTGGVVRTGDNTNIVIYIVIAVVALIACIVALYFKSKKGADKK